LIYFELKLYFPIKSNKIFDRKMKYLVEV
jgi:hypothetical protein